MFTRTGARRGERARDDGARKFAVDIPEMWRRPEKVSEETLLGAKKPLKKRRLTMFSSIFLAPALKFFLFN